MGEVTIRYKKKFLEMLPIPNEEDESFISEMVIDIKASIASGYSETVKDKKEVIEQKLCKLYGLSKAEILIIENM